MIRIKDYSSSSKLQKELMSASPNCLQRGTHLSKNIGHTCFVCGAKTRTSTLR